jgi:flagellar export protein FliJ
LERFSFRLENVLRLRKKIEENQERDFSRKKAELLRIEGEIRETKSKLRDFMRESSYNGKVFTAFDIVSVDNYITRIHRVLEGLSIMQSERKKAVQHSLDVLTEARKERKVIENLKERMLSRYLYALNREEAIELDDVNQHIGLNKEKLTIDDIPLEET